MKRVVKVQVPVEKRGWFGRKKVVLESRMIEIDTAASRGISYFQEAGIV